MADLAQLERALINADKAGDTAAAQAFAGEIRKMRGAEKVGAGDTAKPKGWGEEVMGGLASGPINAYLGVKQLVSGGLSPIEQDILQQNREAERAAPIASIASNIGTIAPAMLIPGVNTAVGAAALGATTGGVLTPTMRDESRLTNAAIGGVGGAAGQGIANAAGRIIRPVRSALEPQAQALADKAAQMGINLNAAQRTGSKPLRWIDSALDNLPITADKQAAQKLAQRESWQRAALSGVGENADTATADVMGKAYDRIGQSFRDLAGRNSVALDPQAQFEIAKVAAQNAKAGPLASSKVAEVTKWLDDMTKPGGSPILGSNGNPIPTPPQPISGKQYQEVRSILARKAQDAFSSGDSQLGQSLKGIRNALDDAAERSVAPQDAQAWKLARDQWKTLKSIEKATDPTTGTISPKKLVNELTRKNPQGMIYGKGDQKMADVARVGKQFIAENLPDSGTAQRSWYMNMMQNPTAGIGGLLGFATGGPVGAIGGLAAGAATPLAAHNALWSGAGQKYFSKGAAEIPQTLADLLRAGTVGGAITAPLQAGH